MTIRHVALTLSAPWEREAVASPTDGRARALSTALAVPNWLPVAFGLRQARGAFLPCSPGVWQFVPGRRV